MNDIAKIKITPRERDIYNVLSDVPLSSSEIAQRVGICWVSPSEAAARHCISLTKKGLAVKRGSRMFPKWARA
jgi:hypothetical protein